MRKLLVLNLAAVSIVDSVIGQAKMQQNQGSID